MLKKHVCQSLCRSPLFAAEVGIELQVIDSNHSVQAAQQLEPYSILQIITSIVYVLVRRAIYYLRWRSHALTPPPS